MTDTYDFAKTSGGDRGEESTESLWVPGLNSFVSSGPFTSMHKNFFFISTLDIRFGYIETGWRAVLARNTGL